MGFRTEPQQTARHACTFKMSYGNLFPIKLYGAEPSLQRNGWEKRGSVRGGICPTLLVKNLSRDEEVSCCALLCRLSLFKWLLQPLEERSSTAPSTVLLKRGREDCTVDGLLLRGNFFLSKKLLTWRLFLKRFVK